MKRPGRVFINWRIHLTSPLDLAETLSIAEYAKKHHLDYTTVKYRIATYKLVAYKIKNKWWIKEYPRAHE